MLHRRVQWKDQVLQHEAQRQPLVFILEDLNSHGLVPSWKEARTERLGLYNWFVLEFLLEEHESLPFQVPSED